MDKYGHDFYTAQKNFKPKKEEKNNFFFHVKNLSSHLFIFVLFYNSNSITYVEALFFLYFVQSLSSFYFLFRQKKPKKREANAYEYN